MSRQGRHRCDRRATRAAALRLGQDQRRLVNKLPVIGRKSMRGERDDADIAEPRALRHGLAGKAAVRERPSPRRPNGSGFEPSGARVSATISLCLVGDREQNERFIIGR